MDALTFGSDVLLRHMTFAEAKKMPIKFIDLCILLGCDYCESIRGVGPKKAFELIKAHGDIESVLENIDTKKYQIPENWPYKRARELFLHPEVADCESLEKYQIPENWPYKRARELFLHPEVADCESLELVWKEPDVDGILKFMCEEKNFK
ncbi:unnamed protein product [Cylicostephanus goldi]|uniref:XPG-I domain-containing protein n=1 Tax=Cylicostephanus goldi TaxID=71465 RepID=A0A3P7NAX3_CYLGO|nr:unnamed protein product [Cylicostephanus goldi]